MGTPGIARLRPVVETSDSAPSSKLREAMSDKPGGYVGQAGSAAVLIDRSGQATLLVSGATRRSDPSSESDR